MTDPYLAEIRTFAFKFAPQGWAFCDGQILPITQNTALFSLIGTNYGGDGRTTFGLPNLQGAAPMDMGQGPGLTLRVLGESGGSSAVTLLTSQMALHSHSLGTASQPADISIPDTTTVLTRSKGGSAYETPPVNGASLKQLAPSALSPIGGGQPHNNLQPYLPLNFCIALVGIYPPRQ
jgi:microcystin-dependent protein